MRKIRYTFLVLLLFCSNIRAQRVLEPDDWSFYWSTIMNPIRMEQMLGMDYDFACLYQPGIAKPDYGYAYFSKKRKIVLAECQTHFPLPTIKRNPDGSMTLDADGNVVLLPFEKVKIKKQSFKIPDSIGIMLNELFQLAVLTAHRDTCLSEEPPMCDGWNWTFFTRDNSIGVTDSPIYVTCVEDTSHNVRSFYSVHHAIERSIRTKDIQYIVKKMPDIQALIEDWRSLLEKNKQLSR